MKSWVLLYFLFLSTLVFADNSGLLFSPKGVAEVRITLPDGMSIDDIQKDVDTRAYMTIRNSSSSEYGEESLYSGYVLIEGRGNTSWTLPKKPYNIELIDENGNENPDKILDMPSHHKWCLITYYSDKSLMRTPLAFYIGQRLKGIPYTPRLQYVELYVNEEYRGLYSFSEKIERDSNRVDIKKLTSSDRDQEENRISGGYILETTPEDRLEEGQKYFKTSRGQVFTFKYPKNKNVTDTQIKWIKSYINEIENGLYSGRFFEEDNRYYEHLDEQSFVDWYILQEFAKNNDSGFYASVFLQKDRDDKLAMSAPWDFDMAFGNIYNRDCLYDDSFWLNNNKWYKCLMADSGFAQKVLNRYDELMPLLNQIPEILETNREYLEKHGYIERNFERWDILG